jgi:hypothetical protein
MSGEYAACGPALTQPPARDLLGFVAFLERLSRPGE